YCSVLSITPTCTLFPYTTLFRSHSAVLARHAANGAARETKETIRYPKAAAKFIFIRKANGRAQRGPRPAFRPRRRRRNEGHRRGFSAVMSEVVRAVR